MQRSADTQGVSLSLFYFFYFAIIGVQAPYWAPYLKSLSFGAAEIGQLMAVLMVTKVFAPSIWGWIGDHYGGRMRLVRLGSLATLLIFAVVPFLRDFWPLALTIAAYSFFWNAVLPQFEVITLSRLGDQPHYYSRIRLWGSIGFTLMVLVVGVLVGEWGIASVPWFMALAMLGMLLVSLWVEERPVAVAQEETRGFRALLLRPDVLSFFIASALMQVGHGPYYTFFSIYMADQGHSSAIIGMLWALGVVAEIVLFWFMHRLMPRVGVKWLLLSALLLAALRWALLGLYPDNFTLVVLTQLLHAATFGSFHSASIEYVRQSFGHAHAGQGQAFYSGISFGGGAALGALLSGYGWEWYGGGWTFIGASVVSLLAALLVWRCVGLCHYKSGNCCRGK
ncbi:MFS transporter [Aestuariirhabdus litorea]|uniref:MFS transporter n=1 Tax=Aestuariirhabdus litorea TaxID=2528527 RepID=A0A3P3VW37_9GAMM|nr:MFS transporter [Aestuariirhabdus litorea]RRJ84933.1 MFS transporter [Aestuariirhabdus litorea]RWW98158.1 MFS transporter [Endozoicomonadaceae bacterium GTF-13]